MRDEAQLWWEQSQADYDNARRVKDLEQWYLVAFLVQQACEKALKAVHVEVNRALPDRTHSLIKLGKTVSVPDSILSYLRRINADYISTRYPDVDGVAPKDAYDESMIDERLSYAAEVIEWAETELSTTSNEA